MGRMSELVQALAELKRCGEKLIGISESLAEIFSAADEPVMEKPKKVKVLLMKHTELLAQKYNLLEQAVEETKNKLETLKTAQQQADRALNNRTIAKDQYDARQREIIETEQELERLEKQANQSATALQKISATGKKLQEVGGKIEGASKKLLPVTAIVTVLDRVISAVNTITTIVPKVAGVIKAVQEAFATLNDMVLVNPIVLIIAVTATLVAAFIYLWNTNEKFRQFWIDLWEDIKELVVVWFE